MANLTYKLKKQVQAALQEQRSNRIKMMALKSNIKINDNDIDYLNKINSTKNPKIYIFFICELQLKFKFKFKFKFTLF